MKKIIITSALLLATLALVLLGLFLPDIAFSYQNRQIQETVKQEEMEQISFSWSTGLIDTMRLLSSCDYNLTDDDNENYDTSEIIDIITNYVSTLYDYELMINRPIEVYEESMDCDLYYAVEDSGDQSLTSSASKDLLSAKVYSGSVSLSNNLGFYFIIDDETGKVAAFSYYPLLSSAYYEEDPSSVSDAGGAREEYDRYALLDQDTEYYANRFTSFFEDYYEYSVLGYESILNEYSGERQYYFEVSESDDTQSLKIHVLIYEDSILFNLE